LDTPLYLVSKRGDGCTKDWPLDLTAVYCW